MLHCYIVVKRAESKQKGKPSFKISSAVVFVLRLLIQSVHYHMTFWIGDSWWLSSILIVLTTNSFWDVCELSMWRMQDLDDIISHHHHGKLLLPSGSLMACKVCSPQQMSSQWRPNVSLCSPDYCQMCFWTSYEGHIVGKCKLWDLG